MHLCPCLCMCQASKKDPSCLLLPCRLLFLWPLPLLPALDVYIKLHLLRSVSLTWDVTHETITTIKIINTSINPQSFLLHLDSNSFLSYLPLHSPPQATTDPLSATLNYFAFSRILYQWNHIAYTFFDWGRGSGFLHLA